MTTYGRPQADKRKQSLYFPAEMLDEIHVEAERLDRSISWIIQFVWRHGKHNLAGLRSTIGVEE